MNKPSTTNWERVDALMNGAIDTSDIPPLTEEQLTHAILRMPREPIAVTVRIDPEVLAWFKVQGSNYERCINAALRIYAEAHKTYTRS